MQYFYCTCPGSGQEPARGIRSQTISPSFPPPGRKRRPLHNHSSMNQDIARGAATEIDAICGAVVHVGGGRADADRVMWGLVRVGIEVR